MTTKKNKRQLSLGDFLKNHRLGEELSQVEMAAILGISKQRLCDIEKDRTNISIKLCIEIAKALDLPPEWLVKLSLQGQLEDVGLDLVIKTKESDAA